MTACHSFDAYAIGWSYTSGYGTACGSAAPPASPSYVHEFLLITISGGQVTVAPTGEYGKTFDTQTYTW